MKQNQRPLAQTILIGAMNGGTLLLQVVIQWMVLVRFGAGYKTDALFTSLTIPQFILAIIGGSLMHVLVPLLTAGSTTDIQRDTWGFLILVGGVIAVLSLLLNALAPHWVPLLIIGAPDESKQLAISLTRIQLIGMVLTALSGVLRAAYHARQRFYWAEFTPLLGSTISIAFLVVFLPAMGIAAAAWANILRLGIQTILLLPVLGKFYFPDLRSERFRLAWQRIIPLLVGTSYYKTDPLVDRFLSSMSTSGGLSLLYMGQQILDVSIWTIGKAITFPMVPTLAVHAQQRDWRAFRQLYRQRLSWIVGIALVGCLVILLLGQTLLRLLIGYGEVTEANTLQLWWIMVILSGFLVGSAAGSVLSSSFYAKGNTRTPTLVGIIGFTLGIGLKIFGLIRFGLYGIAAGASLYTLLNGVAQFVLIERELRTDLFQAKDDLLTVGEQ